ncbi:MAG: hypothetical protein Q4C55_02595 [Eubacterium sp.]|nr:hypothetical protein [Eubacterium sp.]
MSDEMKKSQQEFNDEFLYGQKVEEEKEIDPKLQQKNDTFRYGAKVDEKDGPNKNKEFNDRVRYGAKEK